MSDRIWWLIAFVALGIGIVMEDDMRAPAASNPPAAATATAAAPAAVAARPTAQRGS
jgi:hypothetical protein